MSIKYTNEKVLEEDIIRQLVNGDSQWTYRPELNTEELLWRNFFQKLSENNVRVLGDDPLTAQEKKQIMNQLSFNNYFDAAKWISGENGISKVRVQRENVSLKTIMLDVLWRDNVSGGKSSYEVVHQVIRDKTHEYDRSRRLDISLLINGLPLIHIELKNRSAGFMAAFDQIRRYDREGKFRGIYSVVQMFIVSNGSESRYIAAAKDTRLNARFLSRWADNNNDPVDDIIEFTKHVLSIPRAHQMVMQYSVIDNARKRLILLRPYQIHAIENVKKASKRRKSGYVWHTTGSGKTLTSYKVARNLLQIPSIDKTIFIVDRIDLDQQTTSSFYSYAQNDNIDVDQTENTRNLINKLNGNSRNVIVTTIQKINNMMKQFERGRYENEYKKIKELNVVFVVDECHRAVTPEMQKIINEFFINSLWYGFTGTPIFKQNKREQKGNLAQTTFEQYGDCLHKYTVKEAINDKSVLGFQIEYISTVTDEIREDEINNNVYENEKHMLLVLDNIINKSKGKLGFKNGTGQTYNAILTVKNIEMAQRYYNLIKKIKRDETNVKISEYVKKVLPDFPKVAITYSISENEEDSTLNQDKMKESIKDYNREYGTHFSIENIKSYNRDINDRLSKKKETYTLRKEQIDLVIVVNRLLTGFDAPCLSTLFIDRKPMQPHDIIQAFSRTNRLFDKYKSYGHIVVFQTPNKFKESVDNSLLLYSNGGEKYVLAPAWDEERQKFGEIYNKLISISPTPADTPNINTSSDADLRMFAKIFQNFDRLLASIQVYSEYNQSELYLETGLNDEILEEYAGKYNNIIRELKNRKDYGREEDVDIMYELEMVHQDKVNYEYIVSIIQLFIPSDSETKEISSKDNDVIQKYIENLSKTNEGLANVIEDVWNNIKEDTEIFRGCSVNELLDRVINSIIEEKIRDLVDEWCIGYDELSFYVDNYQKGKIRQIGEESLNNSRDYEAYKLKNCESTMTKMKYIRNVKCAYKKVIEETIVPLQNRN